MRAPASLLLGAALAASLSCTRAAPRTLKVEAEDITFEAGASCDEAFVVFHNLTRQPVFLPVPEDMLHSGADCGLALSTYRNGEWDSRSVAYESPPKIAYSVLAPGATRRARVPLDHYGIAAPGEYLVRVAYLDCQGVDLPDGVHRFGPRFVQMRTTVPPCTHRAGPG